MTSKSIIRTSLTIFLFLTFLGTSWAQNTKEKIMIDKAQEAIEHFQKTDSSIQKFFRGAYAFVVFPAVGKGGMGIGGAHGNGIVYQKGEPLAKATMTQASIGFQFGGQSFMEIIFLEDERAFNNFKDGNVKLGAHASAVALKEGASLEANYNDGVSIFTAIKGGLMYEASVGGQKFTYESFEN